MSPICVSLTFEDTDGSVWHTSATVFRFDGEGYPLIVSPQGGKRLMRPDETGCASWYLIEEDELWPEVAANPGWYALFIWHYDDYSDLERYPVVAWRVVGESQGGRVGILANCEGGYQPVEAFAYTREHRSQSELLGFFHAEDLPQPAIDVDQLRHAWQKARA